MMQIIELKVQNLENPIGIQIARPIFRWKLVADEKGSVQTAYRIVAASTRSNLVNGIYDKWDTGKVLSSKNYGIVYDGTEVASMERVYWSVMVWDQEDRESAFAEARYYEIGLLKKSDWHGKWITKGKKEQSERNNAPILAKEFEVAGDKKLKSARLYISGLGLFEAHVNGKTLGEGTFFNPGECDVRETVYYCTYDITELVQERNAVAVLLGNGQYANYRVHKQNGRYYKTDDARSANEAEGMFGDVKCIAQIVVTYEDGTVQVTGTDETWSYLDSPIVENSWYGGEDYNATLEIEGWDDVNPKIPREQWGNAALVAEEAIPTGELTGVDFEPIRIQEEDIINPDEIVVTKRKEENGRSTYLVDMGQNHAGVPELTIHSMVSGQMIKMYPAEVDLFNGYEKHINQESCTQSASKQGDLIYDTYITKGVGTERYRPRFCYHGYRYMEVTAPADMIIDSGCFKGFILRTNNAKNGFFSCSDETLNRINVLTERSIESNMYSTFTDCPQIEKLGWLETPGLMFYSMSHTYDISSWIPKIVRDMVNSQATSGRFAAIAPEYFRIGGLQEDLNWNGSIIFTAWQYYQAYGCTDVFSETNYAAMKNYMEYLECNVAENHLIKSGQMGEWGEMTQYGTTPVILVETTAYYRLANCMRQIAEVTGNAADRLYYAALAGNIKKAFHENEECYNKKFLYGNGTQSGYGCVLYSGIVLEEHVDETVQRLVNAIEKCGYHLTSGEVGLKQVFSSLAEHGRSDVVYKMVTNDTMPSYKYFLKKELTALPEYWNFEELWWGMARSRNHAMMGHVKEWFTKYLAGISLTQVGYDVVNLKPTVIEPVKAVKGIVDTVHGLIKSEYQIVEDDIMMWKITLPVGVKANVYVPAGAEARDILLDGAEVSTERGADGRYLFITEPLLSGEYVIEVK